MKQILLIVLFNLAAFAQSAYAQSEAGKGFFVNACATCHIVEQTGAPRQGPSLFGIYGNKSGQVEGFKYSDGFKAATLIFDEDTLDKWLANPVQLVPGTIMNYRQNNPERRKAIIDYLKSIQ